jgi:MFS family permease
VRRPNPALLAVFWIGIQVVWGALLGVSLQARASQLAPHTALAAYGLLASSGAAVAGITQIAVGVLSDRRRVRGSRRLEFYVLGAIPAAAALVWFYEASSFAQLVAALIALQIAMNVAIGPYQAVIPDFVPDEALGTASSWMAAAQSVGNAGGALIAGLVGNTYVVAAAISAILLASCAVTAANVRALALRPAAAESVRITRAFLDVFVSRALVYVGFYTLLGYLYFYVAQIPGANAKSATGIVLLIFTLAGAAGAALSAKPANRLDRRAVASAGTLIFVLALGAFLIAHAFGGVLVSAAIAGAAWGVFLTADWALGCRFLPRFALATAMGIWNLALLIPQLVAPLIATMLLAALHQLQSSSAPHIAFMLAGFEVLAGTAWFWRIPGQMCSLDPATSGNIP